MVFPSGPLVEVFAALRALTLALLSMVLLAAAGADAPEGKDRAALSLAGDWTFRLDPANRGKAERWFASSFEDSVHLPGTTDENGKGAKIDERRDDRFSRVYDFKGAAWYQRRVRVPEPWRGLKISLFLDRTKYTRVWMDADDRGAQDGLSAPQVYDLGPSLEPGEHTLTVMAKNANVPPVGPAPALIRLTATLETGPHDRPFEDSRTVDFGLREIKTQGTQFAINGRTTFLRGKNDACIFPLNGHPPMDKDGWLRVFKIAKAYGINHYRFHTWCPPEAAFQAADETGICLQAELPNKASFEKPEHAAYLRLEGERILSAFGNYPSFAMFALRNELGGDRTMMAELVGHFRAAAINAPTDVSSRLTVPAIYFRPHRGVKNKENCENR